MMPYDIMRLCRETSCTVPSANMTKGHVNPMADIAVVTGWSNHADYDKKVIIRRMRHIVYDKVIAL